jgi:predicted ester cyclase
MSSQRPSERSEPARSDLEANKDLIRRWFGAMERSALDEVLAYWAPEGVNHASGRPGLRLPTGREGIAGVLSVLVAAFPDRRWKIDEMIAERDIVVCRMTVSGTFGHKPDSTSLPLPPDSPGVEGTALIDEGATGRPYTIKHMHMFRVANGLIVEHWAARDDVGLLLQLGAIEAPGVGTRPR